MAHVEYLDFQVGEAGSPQMTDPGGGSIAVCAQIVDGLAGAFDVRRSAEWGGETVATIRDGQLQVL